jgi:hypothetical protein
METDHTKKRDTCTMIRKRLCSLLSFFALMVIISVSDPTASETPSKLNTIVREEEKKMGYCDVIPSLLAIQDCPTGFKRRPPVT